MRRQEPRKWAAGLLLLATLFAAPGAYAADGEAVRLAHELKRLAEKNQWGGVERTYQELLATGATPTPEQLKLAAEAARARGDVFTALLRLADARAKTQGEDQALQATIDDLMSRFGHAQIEGTGELTVATPPFRPDDRAAIAFAQAELASRQYFDGFLPVGSYTFGDKPFELLAEQPQPVVLSTRNPDDEAADLTVRGVTFPRRVVVKGAVLHLNGVGRAERRSVSIYLAALYVPRPTQDAEALIRAGESIRLVMHFVIPEAPGAAIQHLVRTAFEPVPGSDALRPQLDAFLKPFDTTLKAGDKVVIDFIAGGGTQVKVGDREATIEGEAFQQALLRLYLGQDPPSRELRAGLLGGG